MITFCSEAILIGDITDFNQLSIRSGVRVTSLSDLSCLLASSIFQITRLAGLDAVACRITVLVASIVRHFILVRRNWNKVPVWLIRGLLWLRLMMMMRLMLIILAERLRLSAVVRLLVKAVIAGTRKNV